MTNLKLALKLTGQLTVRHFSVSSFFFVFVFVLPSERSQRAVQKRGKGSVCGDDWEEIAICISEKYFSFIYIMFVSAWLTSIDWSRYSHARI